MEKLLSLRLHSLMQANLAAWLYQICKQFPVQVSSAHITVYRKMLVIGHVSNDISLLIVYGNHRCGMLYYR